MTLISLVVSSTIGLTAFRLLARVLVSHQLLQQRVLVIGTDLANAIINDVGLSLLGLILSVPVMALAALCIKLDSQGPVLFRQARVGKDGKIFMLYKFRAMSVDAEQHTGPVWASEGDPRVTRVGRLLRKIRLDETPQMFNVLRGDMSFIGPRPERPVFVNQLKEQIPFYVLRFAVKPGIPAGHK